MIAHSPKTHFSYLKQWSRKLSIPIVSVDYRLAPEYPHPTGLNDCFEMYSWLIQNGEKQLGLCCKNIVIEGDSAGGYLAAATTIQICRENVRNGLKIPTGCVLVYPVTTRDLEKKTLKSHARFTNDFMLPKSFRDVYTKAYVGKSDPRDPLISPLLASTADLENFPKTVICSAELDPLFDDGYEFFKQLESISSRTESMQKFVEFKGLIHGFLNMKLLSSDAKKGIDLIQREIGQYFKQIKE